MTQNLYVGNLSFDTSSDALRKLFAEFGEVESVNMVTDRETGRPRGFAFVEMATQQAGEAAIAALNGKTVDSRELKVDKAKPRTEGTRRPGGDRRDSGERRPRW